MKPGNRALLERESALVQKQLQQVFGQRLLEIGVSRKQCTTRRAQFTQRVFSAPHHGADVELICEPDLLPLPNDSFDVVVLHHALEFAENPHALLREVHRVAVPQGRIITVAFNPLSLPGLIRGAKRLLGSSLWRATHHISAARLRDWLHLLGADIESVRHCHAVSPFGGQRLFRFTSRCESYSTRRNWPLGGVYVMRARKQVATLTPRRERRRKPVGSQLIDLTVPRPVPSPRTGARTL